MTPADLVAIGTLTAGFFLPKAQREFLTRVEDFMADIAVIFPFTLTELSALSLVELIEWRERARARSGAEP